jgi:hypothetical protein
MTSWFVGASRLEPRGDVLQPFTAPARIHAGSGDAEVGEALVGEREHGRSYGARFHAGGGVGFLSVGIATSGGVMIGGQHNSPGPAAIPD